MAESEESLSFKKRKRPAVIRRKESTPPAEEEGSSSVNVADLLLLRKLRQAEAQAPGIDVAKLNEGTSRPEKKQKKAAPTGAKVHTTTHEDDPIVEDESISLTKKLAKSNNFTQQTNMIDVDKHMLAYIEQELAKKRANAAISGENQDEGPKKSPEDELYAIAEKYREHKRQVQEGSVTRSSAMLTAIPEVDLGIESRLKNIEATEKAKRELAKAEEAARRKTMNKEEIEAINFARERFYTAPTKQQSTATLASALQSDKDLLKLAREAAARGEIDEWEMVTKTAGGPATRQRASDEVVMARYKDRARQSAMGHSAKGIYWAK